jgi:hypothetical protein
MGLNASMPTVFEQLPLDLDYAQPPAGPVPVPATGQPFSERDDDPAQAEELERQQDA